MVHKAAFGGDLFLNRCFPDFDAHLMGRWEAWFFLRQGIFDQIGKGQLNICTPRLVIGPGRIKRDCRPVPDHDQRRDNS